MANAIAWIGVSMIAFLSLYSALIDYYKPKKDKYYQLEPFSKEKGDFEV